MNDVDTSDQHKNDSGSDDDEIFIKSRKRCICIRKCFEVGTPKTEIQMVAEEKENLYAEEASKFLGLGNFEK